MGCCLSTTRAPKPTYPNVIPPKHHHHSPESDVNGRSPPPPPPSAFEEETVKEVLSETPISKPPTPIPIQNNNTKQLEVQEVKIEPTVQIQSPDEIVSDVSEMCSFTESFSTTTVTDKRDDDGEVTQRVQSSPARIPRKRPHSGELAGGKERGVRSPAGRSAPSPDRRSQTTSRSGPGRTMRRFVGSPNGVGRDSGECSGRRSRSPVARGEAGPRRNIRHKSPTTSLNTTSRPGGRLPMRAVEESGKLEKPNDVVAPENGESLDNPLVSLECFIFL